jgi:pSer/pThr/pTyr-binding forkhead associated (FHA) protein
MRSLGEDRPDPNRPALIVTYGNTTHKYRALERDLVVVGRAPGCDVALASPEVTPVHCILARGPSGWRIRDCSGRGGTRVNGVPVVEGPLKHGDTLQIGAFSFEAHLPGGDAPPSVEAAVAARMPAAPLAMPFVANDEESRRLEIRAKELMQFGEHLRRQEQEVNARLTQRHEEVAKAEATLREQRAEVVRRMTEMARAGQASAKANKSEGTGRPDGEAMRAQLGMVRQELAGRDSIIATLRLRVEQLERELARRPLEANREDLQHERDEVGERLAQLEERRAELEEATREAELAAARERAQLARDRAELERMLDEFRFEQQEAARRNEDDFGGTEVRERVAAEPLRTKPKLRVVVPSTGSHPAAGKWIDFGGPRDAGE